MPHEENASIDAWLFSDGERRNPASEIRGWTSANLVEPHVADVVDPASDAVLRARADDLQRWYRGARRGPRAVPGYRFGYDSDARASRDRLRRRP